MRIWEDYMETIFVTESREMLFTGTEDIDVRPLHSSELHYEADVTVKLDSTVAVSLSFVSVRMPKSSAGAVTQRRP